MLIPLKTMNFLVVCSTNLNKKKMLVQKRIEGFLSAVPAKKMDDNCFAEAALKKLQVCDAFEVIFCTSSIANDLLLPQT